MPRPLRGPLFRWYARRYGVNLDELRLPLAEHASLGAFFVRRLRVDARPFPAETRVFPAPCDGVLQACEALRDGTLLQAKGRPYAVDELLGIPGAGNALEGGHAWTIYLSPRDYHRVHAPLDGRLTQARWIGGARYSVAPAVLSRRAKVLSVNERAVLRIECAFGPLYLVMVGALNVGRIRVVGVEPQANAELVLTRDLARGEELARFELGSTVVLLAPPGGPRPLRELRLGSSVRMGQPIGALAPAR